MKVKILKENVKSYLSNNIFKVIIALSLLLNLYSTSYLSANKDYLQGILTSLSNGYYGCFLLGLIMINTINVVSLYEQNYFYIIRFKNRKMYLKELINNVIVSNTIVFLLNFIILLIDLNLFADGLYIGEIYNYGINNIIYVIYYLLRAVVIFNVIAVICVLFMKLIGRNATTILIIILCSALIFTPDETLYPINSLREMRVFIGDYLMLYRYSNFPFEIFCSTIMFAVSVSVIYLLFYIVNKRKKRIGI